MKKDIFKVGGKILQSRLIVGTGKYKSFSETAKAIQVSGADMVTVAVRRVNILDKKKPILTDYLNPKKIIFLPNTAGCFNSEDALRTLRLAREMGGWKLVKLEVLGDKKTLYPDMIETIKSTKTLVKEGFKVMVYCTDDPLLAKKLEDNGASAIMPLASPIGSGLGLQNKVNISLIIKQSKVPVIVDAGIGTASDATIAMELGCDGVLANTAIAQAKKPFQMALAFKSGVIAGRQSFLAGRIEKSIYGSASSPKNGIINRMVITTIGGVADPGSPLVEIVPLDEELIIEVEISPTDIALVMPGQRAIVKLTAFDFSKFGSLDGKVMNVGADSILKDDGSLWFLCEISVRINDTTSLGKKITMLPGMVAQVDIVNGERTIMHYLLEPVTKVTEEAFREI